MGASVPAISQWREGIPPGPPEGRVHVMLGGQLGQWPQAQDWRGRALLTAAHSPNPWNGKGGGRAEEEGLQWASLPSTLPPPPCRLLPCLQRAGGAKATPSLGTGATPPALLQGTHLIERLSAELLSHCSLAESALAAKETLPFLKYTCPETCSRWILFCTGAGGEENHSCEFGGRGGRLALVRVTSFKQGQRTYTCNHYIEQEILAGAALETLLQGRVPHAQIPSLRQC